MPLLLFGLGHASSVYFHFVRGNSALAMNGQSFSRFPPGFALLPLDLLPCGVYVNRPPISFSSSRVVALSQVFAVSQHGLWSGAPATHELPLPFFGLGHDWTCTFRAPLPQLWASTSSRVYLLKRVYPNSALAMTRHSLP